jgi:hypothetical protein
MLKLFLNLYWPKHTVLLVGAGYYPYVGWQAVKIEFLLEEQ